MAREFKNGLETNALKVTGGTPANGKVLTSDATGNATWQDGASGSTNYINYIATDQANLTGSGLGSLSGSVNGSNAAFTVSESVYAVNTLEVYLNGILQPLGDAITQTNPSAGTFSFVTAPSTGDQIVANYQVYEAVSGDVPTSWGNINGDITDQTDLQAEFDNKLTGVGTNRITVGTTAPVTPAVGDLWYDTN